MAKKDKKAKKNKEVNPAFVEAAKNLNDVMGLNGDDEIVIDGASNKDLKKAIINAGGLIAEGDKFTEATLAVLAELDIAVPVAAPKADKKKAAKKAPKKGKEKADAEEDAGKEKSEKKPKKKGPSAYGQGLDIICTDPTMDKAAYQKALKKAGVEPCSGVNTAYSTARSIAKRLAAAGHLKCEI